MTSRNYVELSRVEEALNSYIKTIVRAFRKRGRYKERERRSQTGRGGIDERSEVAG